MDDEYEPLVAVYEWLIPEHLLAPEAFAAAFADVLDDLPPPARVLDCAAGTGQLAAGLALRGYEVVATDLSPGMVQRTQELADDHGVAVATGVSAWDDLGNRGDEPFDAVFCVGNSITHAHGRAGRRSALQAMRAKLRAGGVLAVTSRNWELVRRAGSGLAMPTEVVVRHGVPGLTVLCWSIPERWDVAHSVDVGVALLEDDALLEDARVSSHVARLHFWPFTHDELQEDLRACGFRIRASSYGPAAERYLVIAAAV